MTRLLGAFIAAPYELFFVTVWILASLTRPLVAMTALCLALHPMATWRKFQLFVSTVNYLVFCNDKKWKAPKEDPASYFSDLGNAKIQRKTVIFVRHGESTWNDTFNKGDRSVVNFALYFVPNLLYAIFCEYYFWVAGQANESWFYDSPLSEKGKRQAQGVAACLAQDVTYLTPKEAALIAMLRGESEESTTTGTESNGNDKGASSQLVSSNLRRAIATLAIGFEKRLERQANDSILILPSLQEISRNPDALSITPPYGAVVPAWTDPVSLRPVYTNRVDTSRHSGNKPVSSNGLVRIQDFCRELFDAISKPNVIAVGHSLWFRSFFRAYLPTSNTHVCKTKKLVNGGVVGFTLLRIPVDNGSNSTGNSDAFAYMIDPASIVVLHGGF